MITTLRNLSRWVVARINIRSDRAATAVEYALMLSLIAAVIIVAVIFVGKKTSSTFECTGQSMSLPANACK